MSVLLLIVAIVLFILAGLGVVLFDTGAHGLVAFGLAAFAASFLVGPLTGYIRR